MDSTEIKLECVIDKIRMIPKTGVFYTELGSLNNFKRAEVDWTGSAGLWKTRKSHDDVILVELTPDLQLALKYIYQLKER